MNFNYDIVKDINNQDFLSCNRELLENCKIIKSKCESGALEDCCREVRLVNEQILRYMYERLVGFKNKAPMAGEILKDSKFTSQIDDVRLIMLADDVRRLCNEVCHNKPHKNESSEAFEKRKAQKAEMLPFTTTEILEKFEDALKRYVKYINERIPSVRGELNVHFIRRLSPQSGLEETVLEADLTGVKDRRDYKFIWKIKGKDVPYKQKVRVIRLNQPWMIGKELILEAVNEEVGQTLIVKYGPIEKDEIIFQRASKAHKNAKEAGFKNNNAIDIIVDTDFSRAETAAQEEDLIGVRKTIDAKLSTMLSSDRGSKETIINLAGYLKEELEVKTGERISLCVSKDKIKELDAIDNQAEASKWLAKNIPDYYSVVKEVIDEFKEWLRKTWFNPQICSAEIASVQKYMPEIRESQGEPFAEILEDSMPYKQSE